MIDRALITGASSGIGLALAREFARNGHPLVIVAPVQSELRAVADDIEAEFDVETIPIASDLTREYAAEELFNILEESRLPIHTLVNNAGIGQKGEFAYSSLERDIAAIRLNIEAAVRMTKLFLRPMLEENTGRVVNTASVAGFEPGPLLSVYHASKAFVLSFTQALAIELQDTGISVMALCPGVTDTDFLSKADLSNTRLFQKGNVMAPGEVAQIAYEAMMRGDPMCVTGAANKAMVAARRFMTIPSTARLNKNFYEDVPRSKRRRRRGDVERTVEIHRK
jgi:uncharacterized protein